jgi:hypothetical protein
MEDWAAFKNVVPTPEQLDFRKLDLGPLQKLSKFLDGPLDFANGNGFGHGTYPLCFDSCVEVMEAMGIGPESVVLEYG